jgi:DNA-binding transcriptional LysR family regulator
MAMDVHGRDLRYFVTVAEELHFTRAAERLYLSQPALSKQIRMLERQLGAELFERRRQGVALTPVGAALLPHARRVLAAWDQAWQAAEQAKSTQSATLLVGMSTSPARGGMLPAIRSRFTAVRPGTTVTLREIGWEDPTAGLASELTDVAFVWLPLPGPQRYRWIVVAEEPRLVAMPAAGPLARRLGGRLPGPQAAVDFADLLDEPFLALPASAGPLREHWLATDARDGKPPLVGAEISSVGETFEALMDGRGIVLLASGNAPLIALDGVITRPVRGLSPSQLALAWRAGDQRPLVRDYVRACQEKLWRASLDKLEDHLAGPPPEEDRTRP